MVALATNWVTCIPCKPGPWPRLGFPSWKVKPGRDPLWLYLILIGMTVSKKYGAMVMQGWRVGDANQQALLNHRGVLGGCRGVHIISQAGHGAQRVTIIERTRLPSA